MGERVFLDPADPPEAAALEGLLGNVAGPWRRLVDELDEIGALGAWSWGGRKVGWELRYKRAGRPFATLTPLERRFSVLVVLGRAETEVALRLPLTDGARRLLDATPQLHDGRWLFVPVEGGENVDDVVTLLLAKLPERVRRGLLAPAAAAR